MEGMGPLYFFLWIYAHGHAKPVAVDHKIATNTLVSRDHVTLFTFAKVRSNQCALQLWKFHPKTAGE